MHQRIIKFANLLGTKCTNLTTVFYLGKESAYIENIQKISVFVEDEEKPFLIFYEENPEDNRHLKNMLLCQYNRYSGINFKIRIEHNLNKNVGINIGVETYGQMSLTNECSVLIFNVNLKVDHINIIPLSFGTVDMLLPLYFGDVERFSRKLANSKDLLRKIVPQHCAALLCFKYYQRYVSKSVFPKGVVMIIISFM